MYEVFRFGRRACSHYVNDVIGMRCGTGPPGNVDDGGRVSGAIGCSEVRSELNSVSMATEDVFGWKVSDGREPMCMRGRSCPEVGMANA